MKKLVLSLGGAVWVLALTTGTVMVAVSTSTVVSQKALADTPTCDGLPCGPCGSKCVCNDPTQICLDNTE